MNGGVSSIGRLPYLWCIVGLFHPSMLSKKRKKADINSNTVNIADSVVDRTELKLRINIDANDAYKKRETRIFD